MVYLVDSAFGENGRIEINNIKRTINTNPTTGLLSSVDSRNYKSIVYYDFNGHPDITYTNSQHSNFEATLESRSSQAGETFIDFNLSFYDDSLHQSKSFLYPFQVSSVSNSIASQYYLFTPGDTRTDFGYILGDTLGFEEDIQTSKYFMLHRYFDFYTNDVPWYSVQKTNQAYYILKSPYVCEKLIMMNGNYQFVANGSYQWEGEFLPLLVRKIKYQYTADTTQIKNFVKIINPEVYDPLWVYISYINNEYKPGYYSEDEDIYSIYNWTSASSSDSVFIISGGVQQLKQVSTSANNVEKDNMGRIVKITNRISNKGYFKVMELNY